MVQPAYNQFSRRLSVFEGSQLVLEIRPRCHDRYGWAPRLSTTYSVQYHVFPCIPLFMRTKCSLPVSLFEGVLFEVWWYS